MSSRTKLGYWKLRGLAQPARLLLKYTGTDFEDVRYELVEGKEIREQWLNVKETLGLDFPNLPYYIDQDIKLTQSNAIMRYIARKNGMCGKDEDQMALIDVLENEIVDFRTDMAKLAYNPSMESLKAEYLKAAKTKLQRFSKFLGSKQWLIGDEITYPDFMFYEQLSIHCILEPMVLDDLTNLKEYFERFEALPAIKAYMQSDEFITRPIYGPLATWGSK